MAETEKFTGHARWAEKAYMEGHEEQELDALREALCAAQEALGLPVDRYWIR